MMKRTKLNFNLSSLIFHLSSRDGFTLVELIVVISVAAVVSVIGIAAFVSYSQTQSLNTAAEDIGNMFCLAKSRAASGGKPTTAPCDTQALQGYKITITHPSTYQLDALCSLGSSPVLPPKNLSNNNNITFTTPASSPTSFTFSVLTGGFSQTGTIVLSGFGKDKTITIDSLGNAR